MKVFKVFSDSNLSESIATKAVPFVGTDGLSATSLPCSYQIKTQKGLLADHKKIAEIRLHCPAF